jgi:hypothetical protein
MKNTVLPVAFLSSFGNDKLLHEIADQQATPLWPTVSVSDAARFDACGVASFSQQYALISKCALH